MHSISGSSIAGKYERLLVVIWNPARRNNSTVAFSRLPFGIPNFNFMESVPVDRGRIVRALFAHLPVAIFETAEKAALIAFMAHPRSQRFHFDQHGVRVAVSRDFLHQQSMSRALALEPQFVARPAVERRKAGFNR